MKDFSRLHPSWPRWSNSECSAYRTWKVLSFLLCLLPVLSKNKAPLSHFKLGAQNWYSDNPYSLSQVLSAFLLLRYHRSARKGSTRWKGTLQSQPPQSDTNCRYFSLSLLLLLLFSHYTAVMAITQPKLHGRSKLLHLRLNFYSIKFKKKKDILSGNYNWREFTSCLMKSTVIRNTKVLRS